MNTNITPQIPPREIPEVGFYYHFKHDSGLTINNYAYEVLGVAYDTEDGTLSVIYRPLYELISNPVFKETKDDKFTLFARPLKMFTEKIAKNGAVVQRFTLITDQKTIKALERIRDQLYKR